MPDAEPEVIPRGKWKFARAENDRATPDPRHVWLEGGFTKGRLYHVAYTATGAQVVGLGPVALRDCAAWLKSGEAPVHVRRAYAYGRSQTGRLLRTLIHYGLNDDERGDEAFDGVIANVAGAMRGEFNQRFGQNSKDRPWTMCHLEPFRVEPRGRLRVMYTNTSAEYHRGDASLVHTDPDGARDLEHGPSVRVYHFAGTEHGTGVWPPTDTQPAPADPHGWVDRSQNLRGVVNYGRLLRACLINLDRWVTDGIAPPPSRHPRVADGTAVAPETLAKTFDAIPGARYPRRHARPLRQDYGADAEMRRITVAPPKSGAPYGTGVSAVDSDGNEVGGIVLPELAVPLATHTGWNLRHADIGGGIVRDPTLPLRPEGPLPALAADPGCGRRSAARSRATPHAEAPAAAGSADPLEQRRQRGARVLARDDGHDLEADQIGPLRDPALQQRDIVALHQLKAAPHVGLHPAADEGEPVRHLPAFGAEPTVHGLAVLVLERLDDHEQHGAPSRSVAGVADLRMQPELLGHRQPGRAPLLHAPLDTRPVAFGEVGDVVRLAGVDVQVEVAVDADALEVQRAAARGAPSTVDDGDRAAPAGGGAADLHRETGDREAVAG